MQSSVLRQPQLSRCQHLAAPRASRNISRFTTHANEYGAACSVSLNCPSPAETARTVADLSREGTLTTITPTGAPSGAPVACSLDKDGHPVMHVLRGSPEEANLLRDARCSLHLQPINYPARGVASVSLQGRAAPEDSAASASGAAAAADGGASLSTYKLRVDACVYYGGLDQNVAGCTISGDAFREAGPDPLRHAAEELISTWNSDRAEDMYRIMGHHLKVSLVDMAYTELLWVDRMGMYIRSEVVGEAPQVVRVPFYRPVLDERDARSVVTMAAQIAWESERSYTPPPPAAFSDAAIAAAPSN